MSASEDKVTGFREWGIFTFVSSGCDVIMRYCESESCSLGVFNDWFNALNGIMPCASALLAPNLSLTMSPQALPIA